MSDSERSVVALKHKVARRLRRDSGPIGVQFEDSGVGESQGHASLTWRAVHRGAEALSRQETEERCWSDRGAVRGEWSRRESGHRSGRAGDMEHRVDDEDARAGRPVSSAMSGSS